MASQKKRAKLGKVVGVQLNDLLWAEGEQPPTRQPTDNDARIDEKKRSAQGGGKRPEKHWGQK